MIDPITAFATAQATIAGVRKAIALGKDAMAMGREFSQLFEAADTVNKAVNDAAKSGKSDTAAAMEFVMQQEKLRADMEELKHQLVYGGYPDLWEKMLAKRLEIKRQRERAQREAERARAIKRQRMQMLFAYGFITVGFVGVILSAVYIVLKVNQ